MGRTATSVQERPNPAGTQTPPKEGVRELVEAFVVAFILALVVRGFEAQAFVIPTGSMAPTLMGRHKELACPQCGFVYSVNASEEVEGRPFPRQVYSSLCVNCRFQANHLDEEPSFKGDRILVMMFPYDLPFLPGASTPQRWDVVVFRYPEDPEVSYIKRLVGLPGETIRIKHGDIYVKPPGGTTFQLQRKPLHHQAAMSIPVYDDRHQPKALGDEEAWRRWRPASPSGWKIVDPGKSNYVAESESGPAWRELRYHHLVPDPEQWNAVRNGLPLPRAPRASLITDFYAYNTNLIAESSNLIDELRGDAENAWLQTHWVGDLSLSATLDVRSKAGEISLDLVEGGISHRCVIDVATGMVTFRRGEEQLGQLPSPVKGPGRYQLMMANIDDRLVLSVDGRPLGDPGFEYDRGDGVPTPTEADLSPAGISVRNGTFGVSDLVLKRDIYYTQYPGRPDYGTAWDERMPRNPVELLSFLSDPAQFPHMTRVGAQEFELGADRFMMMGDNSPRSKDSRGWDSGDAGWDSTRERWEVPRNLVTGKAFYVYWPHGVPFGPDIRLNRDTRLPFRPYFERMKWIR